MDRAYSLLEVRNAAEGEDERTFSGWATTPRTDRMGDSVDPMGAKFKNPLPLLHQHDSRSPIGTVRFKRATADGIEFEASIPKIDEPGLLKDRVDLAWGEIKAGLVRAVSIGFRVFEDGYERLKDGGLLFTKTEILELSAVTIPANADCTIQTIKSYDAQARAAAGVDTQSETEESAASGHETASADTSKGHVVRLAEPARVRASPFVIKRIIHTR